MVDLQTLVLNADFQVMDVFPLMTRHVEDAVTRCYNTEPTCDVVHEYPLSIKTAKGDWHIKWPSVMARREYDFIHRYSMGMNRQSLYYRDDGKCAYCLRKLKMSEVTKDHVISRAAGGQDIWENVVACCFSCNHKKGDKDPKGDWKPKINAYEPTYWQLLKKRQKYPLIIYDEIWKNYLPEWEGGFTIVGDCSDV